MNKQIKSLLSVLSATLSFVFFSESALAQDATKVDSTHYKVEFENDQVRVLRIHYGPGEKSVMHEHRNAVGVILSGGRMKMTFPDGKTQEISSNAGQAFRNPAVNHLPENIGSDGEELILVEIKDQASND